MIKEIFVFLVLVLLTLGSKETGVIDSLSRHIGNVVNDCNDELHFDPKVIEEFLDFWSPDRSLGSVELGCAVACVLKRLELLVPGDRPQKDNVEAFSKANGADAKMISKLKDLYQLCIHAAVTKMSDDGCVLALEIAKCFRFGVFQLHWAPPTMKDLGADEMIYD